jgi:hypothetical protein
VVDLVVTKHAKRRIKARAGINKRSSERLAEKAFMYGITHAELSGSLCRYIDGVYLKYRKANNIRIYNHQVFLFRGTVLITMFPLPTKYYSTIENIKNKRN